MRVLLSSHGASLFGAERVLLALARGLLARGHEVTLEFPHSGPAVTAANEIEGVELLVSERPRLPRNVSEGVRFFAGAPTATVRMSRAIATGGYDVVWVNSIFNAVAAVAARSAGAAVVWHIHERNFRGPLGLVASSMIHGCADLVVAISRYVAASLDQVVLSRKIRVIPNALFEPVPVAQTCTAGPTFTIGYVGQFEPRKRAWDVVAALARLPTARAVLVGDGKARHRVVDVVRKHRLEDRVTLTGFQKNVAPYYSEFDCMVIPSRDEPFGLVALEAMAAGLPVVAAHSGALPEVLGDAAIYYPPGDVATLAECVQRLRDEPELVGSLRERGLRRVREFSLESMIGQVEAVAGEAAKLRARR